MLRSFVFRDPLLCECHRPFRLPRPAAAPTATAKRELSLANAMGEFDASDRDRRVCERLEPSHRRTPALDGAVILFDHVVEILVRANLDVPPARVLSSQQPQCASTRHMTIKGHFSRYTRQGRCKGLAKERLCGRDATITAKQEIDRLAVLVDGAIKVVPLCFDQEWSERPDVVELSSGLSAPNRTCTFQRIRLSISSVAHSKDKISVTRFEGISLLFAQDVRVAFRQPPSELTFPAGH